MIELRDPSRERGVAVDALLDDENIRLIKHKFRHGGRNLFLKSIILLIIYKIFVIQAI